MDLRATTAEAALRDEVRDWLRANLPWDYGKGLPRVSTTSPTRSRSGARGRRSSRAAGSSASRGPRSTAGAAADRSSTTSSPRSSRARAPELVGRIGVNLVGPTLLVHGTPEQKARWLPRILDASEIWCQLFSEPGAGSDLTSLTTRATKVDGGFVVNGQKVWTSYAQFADWGWCLARTDPDAPKSKGISALAIDMHAEGVEVRPLRQITDESEFNEVFFSDVFVPDDQLVGPLHEGWRVANSTLTHERGVNPRQLVAHAQLLDELWRLGLEHDALDDPRLAGRLAQAFVEVRIFQLHNWRSISRTAKGAEPGPVGSINKLWWSEMSKRLHDTAMAVVGPAQPLWRGAAGNPGDGAWQRSWLYYQASSIWAGTNEIQRNVIGERTLGLPREAR